MDSRGHYGRAELLSLSIDRRPTAHLHDRAAEPGARCRARPGQSACRGGLTSGGNLMRRIILAVATVGSLGTAAVIAAPRQTDGEAAPIYGIKIPAGYRDWQLISVAREDGNFSQLRAQLGNDTAIKAYREGKLPFPDGSIIVA